jgi:hypothetical protein
LPLCMRCGCQPCICTENPLTATFTTSGEITWAEPQYVLTKAEQRAWLLMRKQYGRAVTARLLRGKPIHVVAKSGDCYEVSSKWAGIGVALKNVTTGRDMCITVEPSDLPQGDKLFNVLEWLRVRPEYMERKANTIGFNRVGMMYGMMRVVNSRQPGDMRVKFNSGEAQVSVRVGFVYRMLEAAGAPRRDVQ